MDIKFNVEMSPRAIDELKTVFPDKNCSKYELFSILLLKKCQFNTVISIDGDMALIGITLDKIPIIMKGKLEGNNFHCQSITASKMSKGKNITAEFSYVNNVSFEKNYPDIDFQMNKRLDMWYEYIEILLKKSRENTYLFLYEGIEKRNGNVLYLRVSGNENCKVKNLNVGIADKNGEPAFSFGRAEGLENGILAVHTDKNAGNSMIEWQTKIAVYDAAAFITCKRMKKGLDKLCRGEAVNSRLIEFLFEPALANLGKNDNIVLSQESLLMKNMNNEQIAAVEGVLNASDLYLIQGPPGTGKTTVIAEICYQNAVRGLKTLVVSQSNLAVDNAISRVMNNSEVRVLRKGDASRVEEEGLPFVEDNVVRTWVKCVSQSAASIAKNVDAKLDILKKYKNKLPEILRYAEDLNINFRNKNLLESHVFFCKNVLDEVAQNREVFFELINEAYEYNMPEKVYESRNYYPSDFKIPNEIYNHISEIFSDIESEASKINKLRDKLYMLDKYTAKFVKQMRFIERHVSKSCLEDYAYEGVFHYIDSELADNLYSEGEKIINSIPYGIKAVIFRPKWGKAAAIHYRRAENFIYGIQRSSIRTAEKIHNLEIDENYLNYLEEIGFSLDALCQNYDAQYYKIKNQYRSLLDKLENANKEYEYSAALFKEKTSDKFFSAALENLTDEVPVLDEIECLVNEHYMFKAARYLKWKKILNEWCEAINEKNMDYGALKQLYIDNANVIGITCIQSGTADFERNYPAFDVVIIDEASKSTPPDIILPMLKGKKIVLVGDHKQLPPYIDNEAFDEIAFDEIEGETDKRLMELMKISLFEELYESAPSNMKTMLFRQYRMHRNITFLINQFYIDTDAGRLESPLEIPKNHCCQGSEISEENHVLWYDMKNLPQYYEESCNKSFCNIFEADCIKNILAMLNKNLTVNGSRKSVGVITFYDAQVKLLDKLLIDSGFVDTLTAIEVRTGTVDRFQGMEEDIVIISFVRNNRDHNIGFAKDSRRINVALSRARELLIITGCSRNFIESKNSSASTMFREIYNIIKRLDGLRNPLMLDKTDFSPVTERKNHQNQELYYSKLQINEYEENNWYEENVPHMNVLDYFIIKAASEFNNTRLSIKSISGALGIAPVFVKSRIAFLTSNKYISCENGIVKLLENGRRAISKSLPTS